MPENDAAVATTPSMESIESRFAALAEPQPEAPADEATPKDSAAPQEAEADAPADAEAPEGEPDQQPDEAADADNLVDIELDGKVFRAPPEVKDAVMRHADYTRKTMELADQRKLFQAEQQLGQVQAAFHKSAEPELTRLASLDNQIAQFKQLPWDTFETDQIVKARQALDTLKDEREDLRKTLEGKRDEFLRDFQRHKDDALSKAGEYLKKTIPAWGPDAQKSAAEAAMLVGFSKDEVANFMDPRAVQLAWKASQWDKIQASKVQVTQKVKTAPPAAAKPAAKDATASASAVKDRQLREAVRKSGSLEDVARLFAHRMR